MDIISVELNEKILDRLTKIAAQTKKSKSFHICKALEDYLQDLEDICDAEMALKDIESGKVKLISWEELQKRNGLDQANEI